MARSMAFEDLATVVYVWVDDGYQDHAAGWRQGQAGAKPRFRDSEVITRLLHGLPALSGGDPVPGLCAGPLPSPLSAPAQPEPVQPPGPPPVALGRGLAPARDRSPGGATRASLYLLDTKPLPVVGYQRDKGRSDFAATADYGVCASRNLKYFGYKLVLLCIPAGVPAAYELVPASTEERVAGEQVLDWVWQARILGNKGFIGADGQAGVPRDPGPGHPDPRAHQPAHRPVRRFPAVAPPPAGTVSRKPSMKCITPGGTWSIGPARRSGA